MKSRISRLDIFSDDAIEMCARKIAAWSGDVRKALELCRRAAEICWGAGVEAKEKEAAEAAAAMGIVGAGGAGKGGRGKTKKGGKRSRPGVGDMRLEVGLQHVNRANRELTTTDQIQFLEHGSLFEQLWMVAVVLQEYYSRTDDGNDDVYFEVRAGGVEGAVGAMGAMGGRTGQKEDTATLAPYSFIYGTVVTPLVLDTPKSLFYLYSIL